MNDFEKAIDNCPYDSNWWIQRNAVLNVVEQFIEKKECEWCHVYEKHLGDATFRSIAFYIYHFVYIWTDTIIDGKVESSQLDKPYNDYTAIVLYCNVNNAPPFAPLLFKWIDDRDIEQIA